MSLGRSLSICSLLLVLSLTTACGMSEGQSVNLYLGSVTVHERRLEDDAARLNTVMEQPLKGENLQAALTIVKGSLKSTEASLKEIEAVQVPKEAGRVHEYYLKQFKVSRDSLTAAKEILEGAAKAEKEPTKRPDNAAQLKKLQQLNEQTAELDKRIDDEIAVLAKTYPEVKIPGYSDAEANSQQQEVH